MRQRLASSAPVQPLDLFASILEPVKGYSRHAQNYSITTPLNRLVDSIPPESNAAREFNEEVLKFLHLTSYPPDALIQKLTTWQENANAILPLLKNNSLLTENVPVAEAIIQLCEIGKEAIASRTGKGTLRLEASAIVAKLSERQGDLLIKIAPGIENLVEFDL